MKGVDTRTTIVLCLGLSLLVTSENAGAQAPGPQPAPPTTSSTEPRPAETQPASTGTTDSPQEEEGSLFEDLLDGRCKTAICMTIGGTKNWLGIEPLVELPIGKSFTFNTGGLAEYVNNHDIQVQFAAGLRVWVLRDQLSFAVYLSQPITPRDSRVRIPGSSFDYPASYVRRPFPGIGIGLLFDTIWIGLDNDQLRNGDNDAGGARDPAYQRNALVSSAWTWTVALQPFTAFRTGIGTVISRDRIGAEKKKAQKAEEEKKKAEEEKKKAEEEKKKAEEEKKKAEDELAVKNKELEDEKRKEQELQKEVEQLRKGDGGR